MSTDSNTCDGGRGDQIGLSESDRYRLLADERRRIAFDVLAEQSLPMTLGDLAEAIAARELETEEVEDGVVDELMTELYHRHLPRMSQLGVIDYDRDAKRIEDRRANLDSLTE